MKATLNTLLICLLFSGVAYSQDAEKLKKTLIKSLKYVSKNDRDGFCGMLYKGQEMEAAKASFDSLYAQLVRKGVLDKLQPQEYFYTIKKKQNATYAEAEATLVFYATDTFSINFQRVQYHGKKWHLSSAVSIGSLEFYLDQLCDCVRGASTLEEFETKCKDITDKLTEISKDVPEEKLMEMSGDIMDCFAHLLGDDEGWEEGEEAATIEWTEDDICECVSMGQEMAEKMRDAGEDEDKLKAISEAYMEQIEFCEQITKGLSDQEKEELTKIAENCPDWEPAGEGLAEQNWDQDLYNEKYEGYRETIVREYGDDWCTCLQAAAENEGEVDNDCQEVLDMIDGFRENIDYTGSMALDDLLQECWDAEE